MNRKLSLHFHSDHEKIDRIFVRFGSNWQIKTRQKIKIIKHNRKFKSVITTTHRTNDACEWSKPWPQQRHRLLRQAETSKGIFKRFIFQFVVYLHFSVRISFELKLSTFVFRFSISFCRSRRIHWNRLWLQLIVTKHSITPANRFGNSRI